MSRTYIPSSPYSVQPYRIPYRKSYGFIIMALLVLIMSWESGRMDAALAQGSIPQEAIRLRILANSDSPADQAVKRVVRDEIVKAMNNWAVGLENIEQAREAIASRLPEVESIVAGVLESRGFADESSAMLGPVQFPTKMYGSKVYPAGEYEALLITIGEGNGQNWWCVLFPPLCFIDAATGEASAASSETTAGEGPVNSSTAAGNATASATAEGVAATGIEDVATTNESPEVRFFLWELIQKIIAWIKSLF